MEGAPVIVDYNKDRRKAEMAKENHDESGIRIHAGFPTRSCC